MEKRIDFLQSDSGAKKKAADSRIEKDKIAWTAPGPALLSREPVEKKSFKDIIKAFGVFKKEPKKVAVPAKDEGAKVKIAALFKKKESQLKNNKIAAPSEPKEDSGGFIDEITKYFHSRPKNRPAPPPPAHEKEHKIELKKPEAEYRHFSGNKIDLAGSLKRQSEKKEPAKKPEEKPAVKKEEQKKPREEEKNSAEWSSDSFKGTNLIKEQVTSQELKKRAAVSLALVLAAVILIGSANYGLALWAKKKVDEKENISAQIDRLNKEKREKYAELDEAFIFENRLRLAKILIDRHVYWTSFFEFLEVNTLENVYFSNFGGDTKGEYALDAIAKDFKSVTKQIDVLKKSELVKEAQTAGGSFDAKESSLKDGKSTQNSGVSFRLRLVLDKKIFNKLPK